MKLAVLLFRCFLFCLIAVLSNYPFLAVYYILGFCIFVVYCKGCYKKQLLDYMELLIAVYFLFFSL